jgi:hypothetical protein
MIQEKGWAARQAGIPILYYLSRDEALKERGLRKPQSTRTIHRILREQGRIAPRLPTVTEPIERPPPMRAPATRLQRRLQRRGTIRTANSTMW